MGGGGVDDSAVEVTRSDPAEGSPTPRVSGDRPHRSDPDRSRTGRSRLRFWRSPAGQPPWARPALLVVAGLAALEYSWGIGTVNLEPFYGAAARSMSQSWHDFLFAAVDPWGTVSVDKLPGALWVQALSLRIFGFHPWAIVLPQVVEGTLTVLVLFRAVRRLAGPLAGLGAAAVLAISPSAVLLNRGNVSDSLLILLLVLAADATSAAVAAGRSRSLVVAGLWVGLAFQAKMVQAWLVLPALYFCYLVAAPTTGLLRRAGHVALSAVVVVAVSLSWMTAVAAVPAHERPYVDGSCDDSVYSQVFLYDGLDRLSGSRLGPPGCTTPWSYQVTAAEEGMAEGLNAGRVPAGWQRLLTGIFGRTDAWMLLPCLVAAAALLWVRRRRPRTDDVRAATILWTSWLLVTAAFFSAGRYINLYYVAALIPAVGALCGMGAALAWARRGRATTRAVVAGTTVVSTAYGLMLIPARIGLRAPVVASVAGVAAVATGVSAVSLLRHRVARRATAPALGLCAAALVLTSAWASACVVVAGLGPFDSPFEPANVIANSQIIPARERRTWPRLDAELRRVPHGVSEVAVQGSALAGYEIMATGREILPIGGFTGQVPAPSLSQFVRDVRDGRVVLAEVAVQPLTTSVDMRWAAGHCRPVDGPQAEFVSLGTAFRFFDCHVLAGGGRIQRSPGAGGSAG